ncbi:MAG: hypothetical protein AB7J19_03615 [Beijerinckiaceae bacterium]
MTDEELEAARAAAQAEVDKLEADLGDALIGGGDKDGSLSKRLQKAKARLDEIDARAAAIGKAQQREETRHAEAQALAEAEERKRLVEASRDDYRALVKAAAGVDDALKRFDGAMAELGAEADRFIDNYRVLGMDSTVSQFLRARGWCGEVLTYFKNRSERSMRNHMAMRNILTFGSGKAIVETMPTFDRALPEVAAEDARKAATEAA